MSSRFEYRTFGRDLSAIRDRLPDQPSERSDRIDTYLLNGSFRSVFKLRGGTALDLKTLEETRAGFQRWRADGLIGLPATGETLMRSFDGLPLLEMWVLYDAAKLRAAFSAYGFDAIAIRKDRQQFECGRSLAEYTRLTTPDGEKMQSIAIEGEDLAALSRLRDTIGMSAFHNESFPEWLRTRIHHGWDGTPAKGSGTT